MRRTSTAAVATALALLTCVPAAFGAGGGGGKSADAPGQERAIENCTANIEKQAAKGRGSGDGNNGSKPPEAAAPFEPSVTNCDHFWQTVPNN
jgi:hypothetical protein